MSPSSLTFNSSDDYNSYVRDSMTNLWKDLLLENPNDADDENDKGWSWNWNVDDSEAQAMAKRILEYSESIFQRSLSLATIGAEVLKSKVRDHDVRLGQSRSYSVCKGNIRLREEISKYYETYHSTSKEEKFQVTKEIVNTVIRSGGRFLKKKSSGSPNSATSWVVAGHQEAREKVSITFRNITKSNKRNAEEFLRSEISFDVQKARVPFNNNDTNKKRRGQSNS